MKIKLGDCVELVNSKTEIDNASNYNYVTTDNLLSNRGGVVFPAKSLPNVKYAQTFQKGDVLISNIRPYFKKIWQAEMDGTRSADVLSFRVKDDRILLQDYLYTLLQSNHFFDYVTRTAKGTKMPRGDREAIKQFELELPSVSVQRQVAKKIITMEKKIELNKHINDNLANLIDTIYDKMLCDSNSSVQTTMDQIGSIVGGGTPSTKNDFYWNGDISWITPKDLSNSPTIFTSTGSKKISQLGLENSSAKLVPQNTILFSSRAPIGYISIASNEITTNQGFKSVVPDKGYPYSYIYEVLKTETKRIISEANGSTFKEVSAKQLKKHSIQIPNKKEILFFDSKASYLFDEIKELEVQNKLLISLKSKLLEQFF